MGDKGEQLGIVPLSQAQETARKAGIDLVEVAPNVVPPVCRLLDYGKFRYEQAKKEQEARKGQRTSALREIRIRPKIGEHDLDAKTRSAKKLLASGDKVKATIIFRGREITHPDLGWKLLQRVADLLKEVGTPERQPLMEGRQMFVILAPGAAKAKPKEEPREVKKGIVPPEAKKEEVKEVQNAKT